MDAIEHVSESFSNLPDIVRLLDANLPPSGFTVADLRTLAAEHGLDPHYVLGTARRAFAVVYLDTRTGAELTWADVCKKIRDCFYADDMDGYAEWYQQIVVLFRPWPPVLGTPSGPEVAS